MTTSTNTRVATREMEPPPHQATSGRSPRLRRHAEAVQSLGRARCSFAKRDVTPRRTRRGRDGHQEMKVST
jgi:hypothetical protein